MKIFLVDTYKSHFCYLPLEDSLLEYAALCSVLAKYTGQRGQMERRPKEMGTSAYLHA